MKLFRQLKKCPLQFLVYFSASSEWSLNAAMSKEIGRLYKFGRFELDPAQRVLMRDGRIVQLTPKAVDLLLALVESHGRGS